VSVPPVLRLRTERVVIGVEGERMIQNDAHVYLDAVGIFPQQRRAVGRPRCPISIFSENLPPRKTAGRPYQYGSLFR